MVGKDTHTRLTVLFEVVLCVEFVRARENIMKLFLQLEGQCQKNKHDWIAHQQAQTLFCIFHLMYCTY